MNTDGVAIFKSSKVSMWPVYLLINELPLSDRKARENTLFYGVWISSRKPVMWSFLQPLYNDLIQLENGVTFEDYNGDKFTSQAVLLTCTCDLPAKSLVCNSLQFNGNYGCWHCLQRGSNFRTPKGGNVHVFPYNERDPCGPARTIDSIKSDVDTAVAKIKNGEKDYVENVVNSTHYSFDFAQQVHYPANPRQPGPIYFLTGRKCGLFGVSCETVHQRVNYLIDEGASAGKGSNAVISLA